jgi:hypothetical protein
MRGVRYRHLGALQDPPHATLAHGGAGVAYALWRLGERRLARGWLRDALGDRRRVAYGGLDRGSFFVGRPGVLHVRALLARAPTPVALGTGVELIGGAAGHLLGALARGQRDRRSAMLADRIAVDVRGRARRPWRAIDGTNLAHRWPGPLLALLAWEAPEPWLVDALARLARATDHHAVPADVRGTWCTGAAGITFLWAHAYERTGEALFLRTARTAARVAEKHLPARPHLCCGMGGVAYALLAMERIEPGRGWRERATAIAERAIAMPLGTRWPSGLLWGHPGLVCLALDLLVDEPRGFPCLEA